MEGILSRFLGVSANPGEKEPPSQTTRLKTGRGNKDPPGEDKPRDERLLPVVRKCRTGSHKCPRSFRACRPVTPQPTASASSNQGRLGFLESRSRRSMLLTLVCPAASVPPAGLCCEVRAMPGAGGTRGTRAAGMDSRPVLQVALRSRLCCTSDTSDECHFLEVKENKRTFRISETGAFYSKNSAVV